MMQISKLTFFLLLAGVLLLGAGTGATLVNERYQLWQLSDDYTVRLPPGETPEGVCAQLSAANNKAEKIISGGEFRPSIK